MRHLSEEQIQEMFEALGLGTEQAREAFRRLAPLAGSEERQDFILIDSTTESSEVDHAKLAQLNA